MGSLPRFTADYPRRQLPQLHLCAHAGGRGQRKAGPVLVRHPVPDPASRQVTVEPSPNVSLEVRLDNDSANCERNGTSRAPSGRISTLHTQIRRRNCCPRPDAREPGTASTSPQCPMELGVRARRSDCSRREVYILTLCV